MEVLRGGGGDRGDIKGVTAVDMIGGMATVDILWDVATVDMLGKG